MAKKIYLMRHGQTLFNLQKRIQGWSDSPLTDLGVSQAKSARKFFESEKIIFDCLYSSPSERCCDTLEYATGRTDYTRLKGLKEWNFGSFEGKQEFLQPKEFWVKCPDFYQQFGGDSRDILEERIYTTILQVVKSTSKQTYFFASHGAAMPPLPWQ